jgi:aminopeptidase-like protein
MATAQRVNAADSKEAGAQAYRLIAELYPICRSITGEGNRQTLRRLQEYIPLEIREVPSGTEVFDWTVPKEWNLRDASIRNLRGERVVDFRKCNLHVVSYSTPIQARVSLEELKKHIITEPKYPDWVPYRTAYYADSWGFCLSHKQLLSLTDAEYDVTIDSTLEDGSLSYGELFLPGETSEEVLISTHICHPSLCNDNLSGISVATLLARSVQERPRRFSYRFLFIPGSIGSIVWLAHNEDRTGRIKHGLVLSNLGDSGPPVYKKSRRGDAEIDRAMASVLKQSGQEFRVIDFSPYGYDERQYCSPGFNLPVGRLSRTPHGEFPEYHTSADNLDLVRPEYLADSFSLCLSLFEVLEGNRRYINLKPKCEPRLGKRNLYAAVGGAKSPPEHQLALLWVLNQSDGEHSLLDICERSRLPFRVIKAAADALAQTDLLRAAE